MIPYIEVYSIFKKSKDPEDIVISEDEEKQIIEEKDCNEEERLVKKTNSGIYAFQNEYLCKYLPYLKNNNAQKEFYLTDIIEILQTTEQITIDTYNLPKERQIQLIGVNTKEQLEELNKSLGF